MSTPSRPRVHCSRPTQTTASLQLGDSRTSNNLEIAVRRNTIARRTISHNNPETNPDWSCADFEKLRSRFFEHRPHRPDHKFPNSRTQSRAKDCRVRTFRRNQSSLSKPKEHESCSRIHRVPPPLDFDNQFAADERNVFLSVRLVVVADAPTTTHPDDFLRCFFLTTTHPDEFLKSFLVKLEELTLNARSASAGPPKRRNTATNECFQSARSNSERNALRVALRDPAAPCRNQSVALSATGTAATTGLAELAELAELDGTRCRKPV